MQKKASLFHCEALYMYRWMYEWQNLKSDDSMLDRSSPSFPHPLFRFSAVDTDAWVKLITPLHLHHDWPPPVFAASAYSTELVYNYI